MVDKRITTLSLCHLLLHTLTVYRQIRGGPPLVPQSLVGVPESVDDTLIQYESFGLFSSSGDRLWIKLQNKIPRTETPLKVNLSCCSSCWIVGSFCT